MEGRRVGPDGRGVVFAGACRARTRRHVHTSGGRKRGRVGRARVPLRRAAGGAVSNAARGYLRFRCGRRRGATHLSTHYGEPPGVPQRTADEPAIRIVSILTCKEIFAAVQVCADAELCFCKIRCTRPCTSPAQLRKRARSSCRPRL